MKKTETGSIQILALVMVAAILFVSGLVYYRYHEDLSRYRQGARSFIHVHALRMPERHTLSRPFPQHRLPAFTIMGSLKSRRILRSVIPAYPLWAEEEGAYGKVKLAFRVTGAGDVASNIWVAQTIGNSDFDDVAIKALKQWKFAPQSHTEMPHELADITNEANRGEPGVINFDFALGAHPVHI